MDGAEKKMDYFIERTDERLAKMEDTLHVISKAITNMTSMQQEIADLKKDVESLKTWRTWLTGASVAAGAIGGLLFKALGK